MSTNFRLSETTLAFEKHSDCLGGFTCLNMALQTWWVCYIAVILKVLWSLQDIQTDGWWILTTQVGFSCFVLRTNEFGVNMVRKACILVTCAVIYSVFTYDLHIWSTWCWFRLLKERSHVKGRGPRVSAPYLCGHRHIPPKGQGT